MIRSLFKYFRIAILVSLVGSGVHYLINNKSYVFRAPEIKRLGEKYAGQHPSQCFTKIANDLRRSYGAHVMDPSSSRWISLSVGGMPIKVRFLHASWTEYLAVIGWPLAASGHSGIHWTNESCAVLTGSFQHSKDDGAVLHRQDYGPGDHVRFGMFEGSIMGAADDTWMLCYGRGFTPLSGPYLTINTLFVNANPVAVGQLYYTLVKSTLYETALSLEETFEYYKRKYI